MTDPRPVALITMASGYVGPALARSLARRGFDIALQGTGGDDAMVGVEVPFDTLVPELEALGASVLTVTDVDLATAEGNQALVAQTLDRFGRLDSACLVTGLIVVGKFLDMRVDQWERVKRMNLDMVFHGLQAVLPPMIDARAAARSSCSHRPPGRDPIRSRRSTAPPVRARTDSFVPSGWSTPAPASRSTRSARTTWTSPAS